MIFITQPNNVIVVALMDRLADQPIISFTAYGVYNTLIEPRYAKNIKVAGTPDEMNDQEFAELVIASLNKSDVGDNYIILDSRKE